MAELDKPSSRGAASLGDDTRASGLPGPPRHQVTCRPGHSGWEGVGAEEGPGGGGRVAVEEAAPRLMLPVAHLLRATAQSNACSHHILST